MSFVSHRSSTIPPPVGLRHSRPFTELVNALAWILSMTLALIVWQAAIR